MTLELIYPDWPAPANVGACSTTRSGGVSKGAWASLNLAQHVGDDPEAVAENRRRLRSELALRAEPNWLEQVHGIQVKSAGSGGSCADACTADEPHGICVVMTADCLPVLFCNRDGTRVAAAHAGWRGLQAGVLEQTASRFDGDPDDVIAWLGPAIGPDRFEVGSEVREAFMASHQSARDHFRASSRQGHWLADLYGLARLRLRAMGITRISGGEHCTASDPGRFFSYRRDGITGRMASLVWLKTPGIEAKDHG
jgi:YfiH family protein